MVSPTYTHFLIGLHHSPNAMLRPVCLPSSLCPLLSFPGCHLPSELDLANGRDCKNTETTRKGKARDGILAGILALKAVLSYCLAQLSQGSLFQMQLHPIFVL